MLSGLSAFPLTPRRGEDVDLDAYARLVTAAREAGADSIGSLGSTGSYAYLDRDVRAAVARAAVDAAGDVPVIVGVGAISTAAVLRHVEDAASAGAAGVLLAPVSYQPLRDDDVHGLFEDVTERFPDVPVVLYENPATTGFAFSDELRVSIAHLPGVVSIKLDSLPAGHDDARAYVEALRRAIPGDVSIGTSDDAAAAHALLAGCDGWYSVLGGVFPRSCRKIAAAAIAGDATTAMGLSDELAPVWELFSRYGSFRVTAAVATLTGLLEDDAVYAPVRPLSGADRDTVRAALTAVGERR